MAENTNVKTPRPPVGLPVYYHPQANVKVAPWAARIIEVPEPWRGIVTLSVMSPRGTAANKQGVWHKDDPALQTVDHTARSGRGCWSFIPGLEIDLSRPKPIVADSATAAGIVEQESLVEQEARVVELYGKGMKPGNIAAELGKGWDAGRVNRVLDKHKAG